MVEIKSRQSPYTLLDPAQYWLVIASTLRDVGLVDHITVNVIFCIVNVLHLVFTMICSTSLLSIVPPAAYRILWEVLLKIQINDKHIYRWMVSL